MWIKSQKGIVQLQAPAAIVISRRLAHLFLALLIAAVDSRAGTRLHKMYMCKTSITASGRSHTRCLLCCGTSVSPIMRGAANFPPHEGNKEPFRGVSQTHINRNSGHDSQVIVPEMRSGPTREAKPNELLLEKRSHQCAKSITSFNMHQ